MTIQELTDKINHFYNFYSRDSRVEIVNAKNGNRYVINRIDYVAGHVEIEIELEKR